MGCLVYAGNIFGSCTAHHHVRDSHSKKQCGTGSLHGFFDYFWHNTEPDQYGIITFNWNLYQEIPHPFEAIITITIFALYVVVYRFILYRLPILYSWKSVPVKETVKVSTLTTEPSSFSA
jgi:hypothetical protein